MGELINPTVDDSKGAILHKVWGWCGRQISLNLESSQPGLPCMTEPHNEKVLKLNTNWKEKVQKKQHKEKAPIEGMIREPGELRRQLTKFANIIKTILSS